MAARERKSGESYEAYRETLRREEWALKNPVVYKPIFGKRPLAIRVPVGRRLINKPNGRIKRRSPTFHGRHHSISI